METDKIRIHFDVDEKWVPFFEADKYVLLQAIQEETAVSFRRKLKNPLGNLRGVPEAKFMGDISAERPDFNALFPRQFDKDGLRLFTQMKRLYKEWKQEQIQHCHRLRFISQRNEKAIFVCRECVNSFDQVGSMRGVKYIEEDEIFRPSVLNQMEKIAWFKKELQVLDSNVFSDRFEVTENKSLISEFYEKKYIGAILEKLGLKADPEDYYFIACPKKLV
jgi:hypothetical protein